MIQKERGGERANVGISVTSKKSPNVYKNCPKMISLEKFTKIV